MSSTPWRNRQSVPSDRGTRSSVSSLAAGGGSSTLSFPIYLDCDTGVDDALALAYLLRSPEADLVGVGTVSGNTDAATAATNTLALLELAGRADIPVAIGAHDFLEEPYSGGSPHVHGERGFGAVPLAPVTAQPIDEDAAALLLRSARAHPGALRIVAIGPLTNLAIALERYPELPSLVHSVTIMGGAALAPGNLSAVAEANIFHDPLAAGRALAADWDVTLVGLDVTMTQRMHEGHRARMLASADRVAVAVGRALDYYFDFHVAQFGERLSALHDPLAAAIAIGAGGLRLAPVVPVVVDVSSGPGRGQTICDLRSRYRGFTDTGGSRVSVALEVDDGFADAMVTRILGEYGRRAR